MNTPPPKVIFLAVECCNRYHVGIYVDVCGTIRRPLKHRFLAIPLVEFLQQPLVCYSSSKHSSTSSSKMSQEPLVSHDNDGEDPPATGDAAEEEAENAVVVESNAEEEDSSSSHPPDVEGHSEPGEEAAVTNDAAANNNHNNSSSNNNNTNNAEEASATTTPRGRAALRDDAVQLPARCINPASEVNTRLDTQVEVRVYPCNNSQSSNSKKRFTSFTIKPEGVVIQGSNRARNTSVDLGNEYAMHIGRKLQRYELSDTRACQLLVTTHAKSFWVVPAPEAFSRHSGTCRLLGDRKHPPATHTLAVGDFLRVGSVGVVVIETHDGVENRVLSEERIQKIMRDTTNSGGGFLDLAETDGGKSYHRF